MKKKETDSRDIVDRLRSCEWQYVDPRNPILNEAADYIVRLRATSLADFLEVSRMKEEVECERDQARETIGKLELRLDFLGWGKKHSDDIIEASAPLDHPQAGGR